LKKRFLTNLALLVALNLLIKPFWFFGIEVSVQNRVGEEMYGFYFSLLSFTFLSNILLDLGISNYNNRAIARDHSKLKDHLAAIIPLKFILFLIYALVIWATGKAIGYSPEQFKMLWVLVLNQFMTLFTQYLRTNISGLQRFRTDSLLSVMDRSLMILFVGLLLWGNILTQPFRIQWFVYAQTLSCLLTLITVFAIVRSHSGPFLRQLDFSRSREILTRSYPFAMLILLMSVFNRIDSVMLERMLDRGKEEAGIYAQSYRFLEVMSQFSLLFSALLLPMFSRMISTGEKVNELVRTAVPILLTVALSIALTGNFYRDEVMAIYETPAAHSSRIFGILIIGYVFISTSYIFGTLLTANNNLKQLNILAGITVALNLGLNLLLIPPYQGVGAAISSLISQAFFALAQLFMAGRLLRLPSNRDIYFRLLLFLGINLGMAWFSTTLASWPLGMGLLLGSCAGTSLALRLIRPGEFLRILRERDHVPQQE